MKKFSKWLARKTGAYADIQYDAAKTIGNYMYEYHHWINGSTEAREAIKGYAEYLKRGQLTLIGYQHEVLRCRITGKDMIDLKEWEGKENGF